MSDKVKTRKTKATTLKVGTKIKIPEQVLKIVSKTLLDQPNAGGPAFMMKVVGCSGDIKGLTWDMIAFGAADMDKVLRNPWPVRILDWLRDFCTRPR